jgi:2-amino-4-hydroxy-6-hydroxymethyldihydropteridine diphosphokinase
MNEVFLCLGSNINPEANILQALRYLKKEFILLEVSNTWKTKPVGLDSADFLNTAVRIQTTLDQFELKEKNLCHIEEVLGRVRQKNKYAPRTIDIDIVLFNGQVIDENLFRLDYLILPFSELIPVLKNQDGKPLKEIAASLLSTTQAKKYKCLMPPIKL